MQAAAATLNYTNYFSEVEEVFCQRRGRALFLSPKDWTLIEEWRDRGIPLHIVIRSINIVFDKKNRDGGQVFTLHYCKHEVETQFRIWADSQVGKSNVGEIEQTSAFSNEQVADHLAAGIQALSEVDLDKYFDKGMHFAVEHTIARLNTLAIVTPDNLEALDNELLEIEEFLTKAMRANWKADSMADIKAEVTARLADYKADMIAAEYDKTFERMLLKQMRETAGIPRLGLFYL